jgi:hypothetical protein
MIPFKAPVKKMGAPVKKYRRLLLQCLPAVQDADLPSEILVFQSICLCTGRDPACFLFSFACILTGVGILPLPYCFAKCSTFESAGVINLMLNISGFSLVCNCLLFILALPCLLYHPTLPAAIYLMFSTRFVEVEESA